MGQELEDLQDESTYDGDEEENLSEDAESEEVVDEEESSSEEETGEEAPEPEITFTPEQQAAIDAMIGRKTAKYRESEREAQRLREEAEELRKKLPQEKRPEIPPLPDPYEDDYAGKIAAREEAIRKSAQWEQEQRMTRAFEEQQRQQAQQAQQQKLIGTVQTYTERAGKLGVTREVLEQSGGVVAQSGIGEDLSRFILNDEQGPLLTVHLSKNPMELDKVLSMDPMSAAVYLSTKVKPKLSAGGKKRTSPPPPPDTLGTGGAPRKQRGPEGATFT